MTANTIPVFTVSPVVGAVTISTANTARDGTGTIGTVLNAGENGTRVHRIQIKCIVTNTTGTIRLFLYNGTTYFLWREIAVGTAITVSATQPGWEYTLELFGERALILPAGYSLRASTEKGEAYNIVAEGGDY